MSVSLAKVRGRVRARLNDMDGRMDAPSSVAVDMAICDAYLVLGAFLPAPTLYVANAFTISANSDTFTLPVTVAASGYGTGTSEYAGQIDIQLASTGAFLERRTLDEMNALRDRNATTIYGIPHDFAVYEDNTQALNGRVYPGALAAQPCNLYSSLAVNDLRDYVGAGGAEGLDTATVLFGRTGVAALVAYTAGCLVARMGPKALELRDLNPSVAKEWQREGWDMAYREAARRSSLEGSGRTQQWIR